MATYTSLINCSTRGNVDGAPTAVDIAVTNDFTLAAGEIAASSTAGAGKAGDIKIQAGTLELNANPSTYPYTNIASRALASGSGGAIDITTGNLVIKNGAGIFTAALGYYADAGPGGNVTVNTGTLTVLDGGYIGANTFSAAKGGNLTVTVTGDALLAGTNVMGKGVFTGLGTQTNWGGTGGVTQVTAGSLRVIDGASIGAPNFGAAGHGGSVVIDAGSVELDNRGTISTAAYGTGPAGNITVRTDSLEIKGASYISSTGFYGAGKGNAGDIAVTAGRILLAGLESTPRPFDLDATAIFSGVRDGQGGNIRLTADSLTMTNRASISAASYGSGNAGNIAVEAGGVDLLSGSSILSSAYGTGSGGGIYVAANRLVVSGVHPEPVTDITGTTLLTVSAIASQSVLSGGTAGGVRITAGSLDLLDGGRLSTETFGAGAGGNIVVQSDTVRISGINPDLREFLTTKGLDPSQAASGIFSGSHGPPNGGGTAVSGAAGNIQIAARSISLSDHGLISSETDASGSGGNIGIESDTVALSGGAMISAKSSGAGNAGSIGIEAKDTFTSRESFVTTEAKDSDGGNITLNVGYLIRLVDSDISASVGGGPQTTGGNISIDPQYVILKNSRIVANAYEGTGGNISIVADTFLSDPQSVVDASSTLGVSGTVDIRAPISNVSGFIAPLSSDMLSASALLRERCIARIREGKYSSFVVGGRDGLPIEPGNLMPSLPY
jgi:large exoprotein involved in heme utilization and adhesion